MRTSFQFINTKFTRPIARDCIGDGVTGDGSYGDVSSDKIFNDDITGDKIITGEAFSPVNILKISDFELIFTVCNQ